MRATIVCINILFRLDTTSTEDDQEPGGGCYVLRGDDAYSMSAYSRPISPMPIESLSYLEIPRIPSRSNLRPVSVDVVNDNQRPTPFSNSDVQDENPVAIAYHHVTSQLMFQKPYRTVAAVAETNSSSKKRDHILLTLKNLFELYDRYLIRIRSSYGKLLKRVETAAVGVDNRLKTGAKRSLKARDISGAIRPWRSMQGKFERVNVSSYIYRTRPYQIA